MSWLDDIKASLAGITAPPPAAYTARTAPADLAPLYQDLEPARDADYGSILPYAYNRPGSGTWVQDGLDFRFALPSIIRDGLGGTLDAIAGVGTGQITPRAAATVGIGAAASGAGFAQKGAMAMGAARPAATALALDEAARLQRAREMGFRNTPLYHGTASSFPAFDLRQGGRSTGAPAVGIWAAENPEMANYFAEKALSASPEGSPQVIPLLARSEKAGNVRYTGDQPPSAVMASIADAMDHGFDAVRLVDLTAPPEGRVSWVFKDPSQLRSRFAVFDPAKRESSDLLAARTAPLPVGKSGKPGDKEAFLEMMRDRVY